MTHIHTREEYDMFRGTKRIEYV